VAKSGRTVLFVSHNMLAIQRLCTEVLVLGSRAVKFRGSPVPGVRAYEEQVCATSQGELFPARREGSGEYRFSEARSLKAIYQPAERKVISFHLSRQGRGCGRLFLSGLLYDAQGSVVLQLDSRLVCPTIPDAEELSGRLILNTPWLKPGDYRLDLWICSSGFVDKWEGACYFRVSEVLPYPFAAHEEVLYHGTVLGDYLWDIAPRNRHEGEN
jgi:lipopolysaccharide transport system ATP-binding protein